MGTNYFLHFPSCPHCGHADKPLHLGKSSAGWCFGLHVYPEQDLVDWQDIWARIVAVEELGGFIQNECGDTIDSDLFFFIIWHRSGKPEKLYNEQWLRDNHAVPGPYGLARHEIDGRCVDHGEGPFDYIVGDFS